MAIRLLEAARSLRHGPLNICSRIGDSPHRIRARSRRGQMKGRPRTAWPTPFTPLRCTPADGCRVGSQCKSSLRCSHAPARVQPCTNGPPQISATDDLVKKAMGQAPKCRKLVNGSLMPQVCTVCRHENRESIDHALLGRQPLRTIADHWSVSKTALIRHRPHIAKALATTHEAQELVKSGTLMLGVQVAHERSERLYTSAEAILSRALEASDLRGALQAIRAAVDVMGEAREYLRLQGEITGELDAPSGTKIETLMVVLPRVDALTPKLAGQ